jgi:hypothetical protein
MYLIGISPHKSRNHAASNIVIISTSFGRAWQRMGDAMMQQTVERPIPKASPSNVGQPPISEGTLNHGSRYRFGALRLVAISSVQYRACGLVSRIQE